jgi:hypothetical protein
MYVCQWPKHKPPYVLYKMAIKCQIGPGGVVYVVVSSPPATKETGREIESRQGKG